MHTHIYRRRYNEARQRWQYAYRFCHFGALNAVWTNHVTHRNESWHTHLWVKTHTLMSHGTHTKKSWHIHEWVMTHKCTSDGTHVSVCIITTVWNCHSCPHEIHIFQYEIIMTVWNCRSSPDEIHIFQYEIIINVWNCHSSPHEIHIFQYEMVITVWNCHSSPHEILMTVELIFACPHSIEREAEGDCLHYIFIQTYDIGLHSRRHPIEFGWRHKAIRIIWCTELLVWGGYD